MKPGLAKSVIIVSLTVAGAWQAYSFALRPFLRLSSPELLLKSDGNDAVAISKRVQRKTQKAGKYVSDASDNRAALRSLIDAPLSRSSLRIIGMDAAAKGDTKAAASALELAHRVSRRDPWTEAWLLEHSAKVNDFGGILRHYNAALAVHPELAPALNPIMAQAAVHAQVRTALTPYLRDNASWASGFLAQAANDTALENVLALVEPIAHHLDDDKYIPALSRIMYRLAAEGKWTDAANLAAATWPDFDATEFQGMTPNVITSDKRLGGLAWTFGDSQGLSSRLLEGGGFETTLAPLARGTILTRDIPVSGGGGYALTQRIAFGDNWQSAHIRWRASCSAKSGDAPQKFWEQAIPSSGKEVEYLAHFVVPANCMLVTLSLEGSGPDGQPDEDFTIKSIDFTKKN